MKNVKTIITSAIVRGQEVHEGFLMSLESYAKKMNGEIVLMELEANYSHDVFPEVNPKYLLKKKDHDYESTEKSLNRFIKLMPTDNLRAETGDPIIRGTKLAGVSDILVFPYHEFLREPLPSIPNEQGERHLREVWGTGAITKPRYKNSDTGKIASKNHCLGALIIQIDTKSHQQWMRFVSAQEDGSFIDLGVKYQPNGKTTEVLARQMVLGDLHPTHLDPKVKEAHFKAFKQFQPESIYVHDGDDFGFNSHHLEGKWNTKASMAEAGATTITQEDNINTKVYLEYVDSALKAITAKDRAKKWLFKFVKSNHDEHRDKYLERGAYLYEPSNYVDGHILALAKVYGGDPFQVSLVAKNLLREFFQKLVKETENHTYNSLNFDFDKRFSRMKWLSRVTLEIVGGNLLSEHGDRGANGSKGDLKQFHKMSYQVIHGHAHSSRIRGRCNQVGTSTDTQLPYNKGQPSNWNQSFALAYDDGSVQILDVVKGKYCA